MQKPRPTDGTVPHRRHARYHADALQGGGAPLHAQLAQEMTGLYLDLKTRARATEDAEDDWLGASARSDAAEIAVEGAVRALDTELVRADQKDGALNAQKTVFPQGFGPVIEPEGEVQLKPLPALYVRVAPFTSNADVAAAVAALKTAQQDFEQRLQDEEAALATVEARFAEEQETRRRIREQLDSAYGRLRDLYKGRAALAERFFLRDTKRRKPAKPEGESTSPAAPSPPAGAPPATP